MDFLHATAPFIAVAALLAPLIALALGWNIGVRLANVLSMQTPDDRRARLNAAAWPRN